MLRAELNDEREVQNLGFMLGREVLVLFDGLQLLDDGRALQGTDLMVPIGGHILQHTLGKRKTGEQTVEKRSHRSQKMANE